MAAGAAPAILLAMATPMPAGVEQGLSPMPATLSYREGVCRLRIADRIYSLTSDSDRARAAARIGEIRASGQTVAIRSGRRVPPLQCLRVYLLLTRGPASRADPLGDPTPAERFKSER